MSYRVYFYGTKQDLVELFKAVEVNAPLAFYPFGFVDNSEPPRTNLENIGEPQAGVDSLNPFYLIVYDNTNVVAEPLKNANQYFASLVNNPKALKVNLGGLFLNEIIIRSEIATAMNPDKEAVDLYKTFLKEIRKRYSRIKQTFVGREAAELLDKGLRLNSSIDAPTSTDLKRSK